MPKKAAADAENAEPKDRAMWVKLPPEVAAEVEAYAASRPFLKKGAAYDAIRQHAEAQVRDSTVGKVDQILASLFR